MITQVAPSQMSAMDLRMSSPGIIYDYYSQHIPWLTRADGKNYCGGSWSPIADNWGADDTEGLWRRWGKLLPLFMDETVNEIWVQWMQGHPTIKAENGYLDVLTDGVLGVRVHPDLRMVEGDLREGFLLLSNALGKQLYALDKPGGTPIVQSPLEAEGVRLAGGVPPVSKHCFAAIRIPAKDRPEIVHISGAEKFGKNTNFATKAPGEDLVINFPDQLQAAREIYAKGGADGQVMIPIQALEYLQAAKWAGWNTIYSGATSSAKTTTLNAAIALYPPHWRIVTVETGVAELRVPHINWVPLFCDDRIEGMGQEDILKLAMRMSPKPIPNGEIRSKEGSLYVEACVTGHEGSDTSLHAGSPDEAMMRLTKMVLAGTPGISEESARNLAARAANTIVQMVREDHVVDGRIVSLRRCTEIAEVQITGTYTDGNLGLKLVPTFKTRNTEKGPVLEFVGQDKTQLWQALDTPKLRGRIPAWANKRGA